MHSRRRRMASLLSEERESTTFDSSHPHFGQCIISSLSAYQEDTMYFIKRSSELRIQLQKSITILNNHHATGIFNSWPETKLSEEIWLIF